MTSIGVENFPSPTGPMECQWSLVHLMCIDILVCIYLHKHLLLSVRSLGSVWGPSNDSTHRLALGEESKYLSVHAYTRPPSGPLCCKNEQLECALSTWCYVFPIPTLSRIKPVSPICSMRNMDSGQGSMHRWRVVPMHRWSGRQPWPEAPYGVVGGQTLCLFPPGESSIAGILCSAFEFNTLANFP